jgi:hypothetical protein
MSYGQSPDSAALAYPGRGLAVLAAHWPAPDGLPQFCSCGNLDCPRPAHHPIGTLAAADATRDLGQLSRWWLAYPSANLATFTDDSRIGMIELHHHAKADHIIRLLNTHRADPGPVIQAGQGRLLFLVKPTQPHPDHEPTIGYSSNTGEVARLTPGTLVLLPPSRLMNGERLRWMRRLCHTTRLPEAAPLLALLIDFLESGTLDDLHPLLAM